MRERMLGGWIVDNFMDKLAQKLSAQEMIKANTAAEAAETERLRIQTAQYQTEMEEMKKSAEETSEILQTGRCFFSYLMWIILRKSMTASDIRREMNC